MMQMSGSARVWTSILAACLLIPTLGIALQREDSLEEFHKRRLSKLPERGQFFEDPPAYFRAARAWVSDRAFPIAQATRLEKRVAYFALGAAPEPRITIGKDGHVFVNGAGNDSLFGLIESTCLKAHLGGTARTLERSLRRWSKIGQDRKLRVDVIAVPTAASLYADKLPDSVPVALRDACRERMNGNSALLRVRAPRDVGYVYPLPEMLAQRGDAAFFPRANWHPTGLSLKVVRDTYLATLQALEPVAETLDLGVAPSELLSDYGISEDEPTYLMRNPHVSEQPARNAELKSALSSLFVGGRPSTHVYSNTKPVLAETAVMLSDSFGDWASFAFAGAFRQLIHVNTNDLRAHRAGRLLDQLAEFEHIDRLIVLVQEGNTERITTLADER